MIYSFVQHVVLIYKVLTLFLEKVDYLKRNERYCEIMGGFV